MCRANGKLWADYWRNQSTQEFAAELASVMGIPITELVLTRQGGSPALQGTWVAIDLARWCSPTFAVKVNEWVDELLVTGKVQIVANPSLKPYTDRVMLMPSIRKCVPSGHWSVFTEAADLLIWAEQIFIPAGLQMEAYDLLDGSVGIYWPRFRDGKDWAGQRVQYIHRFPDRRGARDAWAYPMIELAHFREWLHKNYVPKMLPDYLFRKYGRAPLIQAAPVFKRLGVNIPAGLLGRN